MLLLVFCMSGIEIRMGLTLAEVCFRRGMDRFTLDPLSLR